MLDKYLMMNPVKWLTDGYNPAVRYLVQSEILKIKDTEKIYNDLIKSDLTQYFYKNYYNGTLGDFVHPDIFYRGSVWFFLYAVESGYSSNSEFITSTADKLCSKTQLSNGGFKFNYKSSDAVGCRSGNMTFSLIKSGISDSRTDNGINWILKNQRSDGGWLHCPFAGFCGVMKIVLLNKTGNGLKFETNEKIQSCPVASYLCLKALVQTDNNRYSDQIGKGADFFIRNNFFTDNNKKLFCGNSVSFQKLGYPVMSQYDYISGLILISKTAKSGFSLRGDLFNSIIKKQNNDGSWNNENRLPGMVIEKSGKSRWTTLNALRFLNSAIEKDA